MELVQEVHPCLQDLHHPLGTKVTTSQPHHREVTAGVTKAGTMIIQVPNREGMELDPSPMALDPNTKDVYLNQISVLSCFVEK